MRGESAAAAGEGASNAGAFVLGAPMNALLVTSVPSSFVTVRATTSSSPSRHLRVSITSESSTSTQTSPSHRAVTVIVAPSGPTISHGCPTRVRFTTAVSPSTSVSSSAPPSRSCVRTWSSFGRTTAGMPVWNAEPNARRNGSWLSTAYVSHEPLEMKGREKGGTVSQG